MDKKKYICKNNQSCEHKECRHNRPHNRVDCIIYSFRCDDNIQLKPNNLCQIYERGFSAKEIIEKVYGKKEDNLFI